MLNELEPNSEFCTSVFKIHQFPHYIYIHLNIILIFMNQPEERNGGKKIINVNWKGAHNTQNELLEEVQSVCGVLTLCIYNRCVGRLVNIYYSPWLQDSLLLAQLCLGRSCFTNIGPLIVDHMLPKVNKETGLKLAALHRRV